MFQQGRHIHSIDEARLADGDVTDESGGVLFRATVAGWLWCGEHKDVADTYSVLAVTGRHGGARNVPECTG